MKKTGQVGLAVALSGGCRRWPGTARAAAKRDYILVGHPNPSTGPIASFGEASPWADDLAISEINKAGGIMIKEAGKKLPIRLKMVDTASDPTKAADVASKLILNDKVDIMIALHTPDTVNPVTSICERYEVPCVALDAPIEAWLTGGPYKWSFHSFWSVNDVIDVFTGLWDQIQTNKVVGALWPNDPDGTVWAQMFTPKLKEKGYKVVDVGRFPYGMQDYSAFINTWKKEGVEIITGVMIPPDWATCWRQCHQQGFIPKAATIGKAILFPSAVEALGGNLPNGLTSEIWWSPNHPFKSSLSGKTAKQLCDEWTAKTKKPWTQPIGFKYAAYEIRGGCPETGPDAGQGKSQRSHRGNGPEDDCGTREIQRSKLLQDPAGGRPMGEGKEVALGDHRHVRQGTSGNSNPGKDCRHPCLTYSSLTS